MSMRRGGKEQFAGSSRNAPRVRTSAATVETPPSASVADVPSGPLDVVLDEASLLEETMLKDLEELVEEQIPPWS